MTDRATHHADEARRILTLLDTGIGYPDEAIAAQVHATLAVAERLAEIAGWLLGRVSGEQLKTMFAEVDRREAAARVDRAAWQAKNGSAES